MHHLLESIFKDRIYKDRQNKEIKIHSETSRGQCEYLQQLISKNKFSASIEIGFAYGISTLAITEEIARNKGTHLVIDRYESISWGGIGLDLVDQAGLSEKLEFYEDLSHNVLPKLLEQQRKFDFAYIDSTKLFDFLMVDFFFLDKLLQPNGIIVFDDVAFPAIRKLVRYISQLPNYEVHNAYPLNQKLSLLRRTFSVLRHLPKAKEYIKENTIKTDFALGINSNCVALKKIQDDKRNWDWHQEF